MLFDHHTPCGNVGAMRTAQLTFGLVLVVLVLDATGGPGWGIESARAVLAARMDHSAGTPLYDVIASAAALLPFGEVGFRVQLLGALLGALTAVGVLEAARVLVPKHPFAAIAGIVVLVLAPPFRESSPALLAACGTVWALARVGTLRGLAACAIVVGSEPYLGLALTALIAWKTPRDEWPLGLAIIGTTAIALWLGADGRLPGLHPSLAAAIAETQGGAIVVGAGLLGLGFGALTGLPRARELAVVTLVVALDEILVGGAGTTLLATLAIGIAVLPAAIVRAAAPSTSAKGALVAAAAAVPLAGAALLVGVTRERPGSTPTRLVDDLTADVPAGPGVLVATRTASYEAMQYEASIAGARPDLSLVPPMPAHEADVIVAEAIRADKIAAADAAAFGRLDVKRVIPRGRGFQLIGELPDHGEPVMPPATYPTARGAQESAMLALERARHEAASGRLDAAARAAGLTDRFHAADLAVLAATIPTKDRPALFGFLPLDEQPPGRWLLDVFGDDLAWVAGLDMPHAPANEPMPRKLHALWTEIFLGKRKPDDSAITALGPAAVAATNDMIKELR